MRNRTLTTLKQMVKCCIVLCGINSLDASETAAIGELQEIITDAHIINDIACIMANYSQLPEIIYQLEDWILLVNSIALVTKVQDEITHHIGKQKLKDVLDRNEGLDTLTQVSAILQGMGGSINIKDLNEHWTIDDVKVLRHAPVVSVDVGTSFSVYKNLLSDNCHRLLPANIKMLVFCYCNGHL